MPAAFASSRPSLVRERVGTPARLRLVAEASWRHGHRLRAVLWLTAGPFLYVLTRLCLRLDHIFYPRLTDVRIDRPVFIVGHPRSGSTFLQHQVFRTGRVGMFRTWELACPSLIQRRLIAPFVRIIARTGADVAQGAEQGHQIRINGVEEDEGLFLHRLDTEIVTYLCPWLLTDPSYAEAGMRLGRLSRRQQLRSLQFYRDVLQRQVLATGMDRLVLKCNPTVFRIRELLTVFPDARIVYLVRSPEACVRSFQAFTHRFVASMLTKDELRVFHRRKYEWSRALYRAFEEARDLVPAEQLLVITFSEIVDDLPRTMERFCAFAGVRATAGFRQELRHGPRRRRRERRHHNYPLNYYDIDPREVRRDLGSIRERYGLPRE